MLEGEETHFADKWNKFLMGKRWEEAVASMSFFPFILDLITWRNCLECSNNGYVFVLLINSCPVLREII